MKNTIFLIIIAVILAGCNTTTNTEQIITYAQNQCEQEPWNQWYQEGNIQFIKEPSQEELIETYYGQEYDIQITNIKRVTKNETVCQACNICPKSYYFVVDVSTDNLEEIQTLGWNVN